MISAALRVKQTMKERTEGSVAGLGRRLDIPSAPPVMQLRSKNFCRNSLRSASSPTPEQADFTPGQILNFSAWRAKIRLFCGWRKVLVPAPNNPFPSPTVAKGITH